MPRRNIGATISLKDGGFQSGISKAVSNLSNFKKGSENATSSMKKLSSNTKSAGTSFASMGKKIVGAVAAYASLRSVVNFSKECIAAANVQANAEKRLETTMMNVKGTTLGNVAAMKKYASELQGVTTVGDEATIQGASQLATFQLQNGTIKKLLPSLQDLAVAQYGTAVSGDQMQSMANLVGKVMAGSVSALTRYGVTLDDNQKKLLKTGNETQRAAVLTEVLKNNFGGLASSMANTPEGRVQQLKNAWGDMQEVVGTKLYPIITNFLTYLTGKLPTIQSAFETMATKVSGVFGKISPIVTAFVDIIWNGLSNSVLPALNQVGDAVSPLASGLQNAGNSINWAGGLTSCFDVLGKAISIASGGIKFLINNFKLFGPIIAGVTASIVAYKLVVIAVNTITKVWFVVQAVVNAVMYANPAVLIIMGIIVAIGLVVAAIALVKMNWDKICNALKIAWEAVKTFFSDSATAIGGFFVNLWSGIKNTFTSVGAWFSGVFTSAWNGIRNAFSAVAGFFQGIWNIIKSMFVNIGTSIANGISGAFKSVINGVIGFAGNLINGFINSVNWAVDIINKIPGVSIGKLQAVNLPMLADGGHITRPGDVIVGERGPERLTLPKGATVTPLGKGNGQNENKFYINIDARDRTAEEIANELVPKLKLALSIL